MDRPPISPAIVDAPQNAELPGEREPFLVALGERVRMLRARKRLTRKALSRGAGVSERHLANLELGRRQRLDPGAAPGGAGAVVLARRTARRRDHRLARVAAHPRPARRPAGADLQRARAALAALFGSPPRASAEARAAHRADRPARRRQIDARPHAGRRRWTIPFVELNREIERVAGCTLSEIHNLYGPSAYRRYERRALEETLELHPDAVIATPGGIVSDAATFGLLLAQCFTVWLQASPEQHMQRVVAQGDLRPMAGHSGNREAMDDLRRILAGRAAFYGKADLAFDTTGLSLGEAYARLSAALHAAQGVTARR